MPELKSAGSISRILKPLGGGSGSASLQTHQKDDTESEKPGNASISQRFKIAKEVWNDHDFYIPRKAGMVLEWLHSVMLHYANAAEKNLPDGKVGVAGGKEGKGDVSSTLEPHLDLAFWNLLDEILKSLAGSRNTTDSAHFNTFMSGDNEELSYGTNGEAESNHDGGSASSSIRLPGFFTTLSVLVKLVSQNMGTFPEVKDDAMELDNASESVVSKYPSILRTAHSSFKSLLSKALVHDVLRPSLDNLVSLSSVVLNAFNESCVARLSKMGDKMLGNEAPGDPWDEFSVELLSLAWTSVSVLYENIVLSPNQKKVFTAISVDRFVLPLLQAHKLLSSLEPPSNIFYEKPISLSTTLPSTVSDTCKSLRAHIISIIDHGLLHHEHLSDFIGVVKQLNPSDFSEKGGKKDQKRDTAKISYPKKFFDVIKKGVEGAFKGEPAALGVHEELPVVLDRLLAVKNIGTHAVVPLETESFSYGFTVFSIFYSYLSAYGKASVPITSRMLWRLASRNVYRRSRDASSEFQLKVLTAVCKDIIQLLEETEDDAEWEAGAIFSSLEWVLSMELTMVLESLDRIMPYLVKSNGRIEKEQKSFFLSLLRNMSKAHDLDQLIGSIIRYGEESSDKDFAFGSFLFDNEILVEFKACIGKALPAEVVGLVSLLADTLKSVSAKLTATNAQKRLRVDNEHKLSTSAKAGVADLCAVLLEGVLNGARLPPTHQSRVESILYELHEAYSMPVLKHAVERVVPSSEKIGNKKSLKRPQESDEDGESPYERLFFSSLTLLLASMKASEKFCRRATSTTFIDEIIRLDDPLKDYRVEWIKIQVALLFVDLQANTSVDPRLDEGIISIVSYILDILHFPKEALLVGWNGSISTLAGNANAAIISKWSAILDNLAPVCRLASPVQLRSIIGFILRSGIEADGSHDVSHYSVSSLCRSALKSAAFFEIRTIRDAFLGVFLEVLREDIGKPFFSSKRLASSFTEFFSTCSAENTSQDALSEKLLSLINEAGSIEQSTSSAKATLKVSRILRLLGVTATLPTSYFSSQERDKMLCILLGIDIYAFSLVGTKTGPSVDEDAAMELLAITRIEIARFFKSRGDSAVMISTPTVAKYLLNIFASPVINLDGSVAGHSITDATTSILELSVMKVLQRLGNRKDERTAGYLSYVKTIVDIIISFAKSNEKIGYILSHAVLAPAVCWLDVRMRQADQDVSLKNMDAEVRSSILGLVSIVTERVLALDMIFNVLDTRHLRSQFDILECLLVFYRLSGDKRVYDFVQELLAVIVKASTSEEGEQTEIVLLAGRLFSIFASHVVENRQEILDADFLCLFEAGRLLLERMCALGNFAVFENEVAAKMLRLLTVASRDQFSTMVSHYIFATRCEIGSSEAQSKRILGYLKVFHILTLAGQSDGRRKSFRALLYSIIQLLVETVSVNKSLDVAVEILMLFVRFSDNTGLELNDIDMSCLLGGSVIVVSDCSEHGKVDSGIPYNIKIFEILCRLLQSVLTHRRQSIIHLIPGVCSLVSTLMECLAENEILDPSLSTSGPLRARLSGLDIDKKVSLARTLSRVLQKFSQKQGVHAGEGLSGSTSQMKPFSKHAPFLISKFVSIHASKRQYSSAVYDALLEGLYSVIDICDDFGRESVLANLDLPGTGQKGAKLLYKKLTSSWKEAARNRNKV